MYIQAQDLSTIGSEVLNSMKKPFLKRMGDFLEGKGFYIVLVPLRRRNRNFGLLSLFLSHPG